MKKLLIFFLLFGINSAAQQYVVNKATFSGIPSEAYIGKVPLDEIPVDLILVTLDVPIGVKILAGRVGFKYCKIDYGQPYYSSQGDYEKSNFYLNISNYLNPKFTLNLSLLAENYYTNEDYENTKKTLEVFDKTNEFYYWFKIKKEAQIISNNLDKDVSLKFINSKFKGIKNPNKKMIFDIANFNKNAKKYAKAINYYDQILLNNADNDLLKSLEINPDDAYVLNYLAYSWLEREYKIDTALEMLENAYASRSNDPYIIDSIGWAYFLVGQYEKAENFLKRAVELMPQDPIVNDHYGDILWKLNRKIQARYFWQNVLKLEETEDEMKKNIKEKLIDGIKQS